MCRHAGNVPGVGVAGATGRDALRFRRPAAPVAATARHQVSAPTLLDHGHAFKAISLRVTGRPWFGGTPMNLVYTPDGRLAARRIGPLARTENEGVSERGGSGD